MEKHKVNSAIPRSAQLILRKIDRALVFLATSRMKYFKCAARIFGDRRPKTKHLGFERLVTSALYRLLDDSFPNLVFVECPTPNTVRGRIDLWLNDRKCPTYIELEMYHSGMDDHCNKDHVKLKQCLEDKQNKVNAMAVQIHFSFYKYDKARKILEDIRQRDSEKYWGEVDCIPADQQQEKFIRFAFGLK